MALRTENDAAREDALSVQIASDFTFRDDGRAWLKATDTLSGFAHSFPLAAQTGTISYVSKAGPRTERTDIGYLLERRDLYPFLTQFVGERRRRELVTTLDDAAEAVRLAVFAHVTTGNRLDFVPDLTVAWTGAEWHFDASLNAVLSDDLRLQLEWFEHDGQSGYRLTDTLTGTSTILPPRNVPFRDLASFQAAANEARPADGPKLSQIVPEIIAAFAMLRLSGAASSGEPR